MPITPRLIKTVRIEIPKPPKLAAERCFAALFNLTRRRVPTVRLTTFTTPVRPSLSFVNIHGPPGLASRSKVQAKAQVLAIRLSKLQTKKIEGNLTHDHPSNFATGKTLVMHTNFTV